MRILVLGGGGREHAIVRALARADAEVLCAPGNGGTAGIAEDVASLDAEDPRAVAALAVERGVDLVVIGPEGPLAAGVADAVREAGIRVFGPSAAAARLEGSKEFAKRLMLGYGLPTGSYEVFTDEVAALAYLEGVGAPVVVKADGLAAGKGVTVAEDLETAREAVRECLGGRFGEAGARVLIEEYLVGQECSLLAFTDGVTVLPMVPAQDHKRVYDGDTGPNTGGMGVYSPVPVVDEGTLAEMSEVLRRTVRAMASEGVPYSGVLYGGFILSEDGPKLLEFNARFGDPETQVILPRLRTGLLEVMLAVAEGRLDDVSLSWRDEAAVSVVLASGGYPGDYEKGKVVTGVEEAEALPGVTVYHAGTALAEDGTLLTAGGRVLDVTALGPDLRSAIDLAYEGVSRISFEGMHYRTDIGRRALLSSEG